VPVARIALGRPVKRLLTILLPGISALCAARAQDDPDRKLCQANDADDNPIAARTRLIDTNRLGQGDRVTAYYNRGAAYWRKHDYDRAIADENAAIEIDPQNAYTYGFRGHAYLRQGDNDQAIADFAKQIELYPDDPRAYLDRSDAYAAKHDNVAALADNNKAIELIKPHAEIRERSQFETRQR
jgi:tetratricopeptide (TPR) repeat protein